MAKNVKLGSIVRDRVSGFEGIAYGRHEYLTGCNKVTILPKGMDKDGQPKKSEWFDEQQLEVLKDAADVRERYVDETETAVGGPTEQPQRTL